MAKILEINDLYKSYNKLKVINGVSFAIEKGTVTALIGPSGCGKSTILRCINMLENWDAGSMNLDGRQIEFRDGRPQIRPSEVLRHRAEVGMVFQQYHLFPHMSVLDNVMSGLRIVRKMDKAQARDIARAMLVKVQLEDKVDHLPRELSGGQAQRVAIARALAMQPKVMLFDEATAALDPELVHEVLDVIRELQSEGMTMILVTHEMQFAKDVASQVHFVDKGTIVESGAPAQMFSAPESDRLRHFLRHFNIQ